MEASKIIKDEAKSLSQPEVPMPETHEVTFVVGEEINVTGIRMRVRNIAAQSIVLHPIDEPVYLVKGVPMVVKKMIGTDLVMHPLPLDQVERLHGGSH